MTREKRELIRCISYYNKNMRHLSDSASFFKNLIRLDRKSAKYISAIHDTVKFFIILGDTESVDAVFFVYGEFTEGKARPSQISSAVKKFATEKFRDERTVYRKISDFFFVLDRIVKQYSNEEKRYA